MKNNFAIIMAGGVGTRFWPWSKASNPKQFLDILGVGKTLIELTYERITRICPAENIFIVTNKLYYNKIIELFKDKLLPENILVEPFRRNTAPCVAYASFKIKKRNPNARVLVVPSDHLILKEQVFCDNINEAFNLAYEYKGLLTLGIIPYKPETGYGYIYADKSNLLKKTDTFSFYKVIKFVEKPDYQKAREYLQSGDYYWNAGIFIWTLVDILNAFKIYSPEIYNLFLKHEESLDTPIEQKIIEEIYQNSPDISIDYAIMEKTSNIYVMCTDIGWTDLGSWSNLFDIAKKDHNNNFSYNKNVLFYNSNNCIICIPENKIAVINGLEDFIVVDTEKELLICNKEDEQEIKIFVKDVENKFGKEYI